MDSSDVREYSNHRLGQGRRESAASEEVHREYIREAEPVGSVPRPEATKGRANSPLGSLNGNPQIVLIDKLGERLAFERSGTRLYEALIIKCAAVGEAAEQIDLQKLEAFRNEEEAHFQLLSETLQKLGADPTSMTPCADIAGVAAAGALQVITDPRTTLAQAFNTLLGVELMDDAGWELLIELANAGDQSPLAQRFRMAAEAEQRHVGQVREWLRNLVVTEATASESALQ
jgi:rubrerythrin